MNKQKKTTLYLTDSEIRKVADYFAQKYPWLCKGNTIYSAELISFWKVEIGENDAREIEHLMKPCNIELLDI